MLSITKLKSLLSEMLSTSVLDITRVIGSLPSPGAEGGGAHSITVTDRAVGTCGGAGYGVKWGRLMVAMWRWITGRRYWYVNCTWKKE